MPADITSIVENLDMKVLAEYDEDYRVYVAHCLETGAVATGSSLDEAEALIKQVLENDISIAIRTSSLESLFHTCAPSDVRTRWYEVKATRPDHVKNIHLDIPLENVSRNILSCFWQRFGP